MPALDTVRAGLADRLEESLRTHDVPGAVVGVSRGDDRVVVSAGSANTATGVQATPDTVFQVGSISKLYTATLVMQLVHAGLVELDAPVRTALQEFRVADDAATLSITPRQLLSHTSGIEGDHFIDCGRNPDALWRFVSTLEELGQVHAPDDRFSYCNAGYGVLGRLVETSTGDHFDRALRRRLLRPAGLDATMTSTEQAIVHRVAAGHAHTDDGGCTVTPWTLARFNTPIGGVLATADDLLDFARLHLAGGQVGDRQVVASRALAQMREGQVEVPGTEDEWGLGWRLTEWDGAAVAGHDGDTIGQRAALRLVPEVQAAIVVLTNAPRGHHVVDELLREVAESALGTSPPAPPEPAPDASDLAADAPMGIYERMHQRLAIAGGDGPTSRMTVIPDELLALAGRTERTLTLHPLGDGRFTTVDPLTDATELVVADGEYVQFQLRAHRLV